MDEQILEPEKALLAISISSPRSGEDITGRATGGFSPLGSLVKCDFWRDDPTGMVPEPAADATANASLLAGRLVWNASLDLSALAATTTGFLRAVNTSTGAKAEVAGLHWVPGNPVPVKEKEKAEAKPRGTVRIKRPANTAEVGRLFLVAGTRAAPPKSTVRVELLHEGDTPATSATLPVQYFTSEIWATSILSFESGDNFRIRATLLSKDGHILSVHSVGSIKIG
jgi:hypothetical protein